MRKRTVIWATIVIILVALLAVGAWFYLTKLAKPQDCKFDRSFCLYLQEVVKPPAYKAVSQQMAEGVMPQVTILETSSPQAYRITQQSGSTITQQTVVINGITYLKTPQGWVKSDQKVLMPPLLAPPDLKNAKVEGSKSSRCEQAKCTVYTITYPDNPAATARVLVDDTTHLPKLVTRINGAQVPITTTYEYTDINISTPTTGKP